MVTSPVPWTEKISGKITLALSAESRHSEGNLPQKIILFLKERNLLSFSLFKIKSNFVL